MGVVGGDEVRSGYGEWVGFMSCKEAQTLSCGYPGITEGLEGEE